MTDRVGPGMNRREFMATAAVAAMGLRRNFLLELLDHDPRVLGVEVIEGGGSNAECYWDWAHACVRARQGIRAGRIWRRAVLAAIHADDDPAK